MTHDDAMLRFDATLRSHHEAALRALSPRAQAQLAQRRRAALRGGGVATRQRGFGYAVAGVAALCALAIGLQFRQLPAPAPGSVAAVAPGSSSTRPAITMLDDDPDFYAWLASSDAMQVAME